MRRVSWASTRELSSSRVSSSASRIFVLVISWNTMRLTGTVGFSTSSRCHEMASPSRSSSVASRSRSTCLSRDFSSLMRFFESLRTT